MAKEIAHAHDKYFKSLMSDKTAAIEFFEEFLPAEITDNLRLDTLRLANTEYTNDALKKCFSDVVFDCDVRSDNQDATVQVSILLEHKSQPEQYPHLQVLEYLVNAWKIQAKQQSHLTRIIPVIFYHGEREWRVRKMQDYFLDSIPALQSFTPQFDYLLVNTADIDDSTLMALSDPALEIGLLLMKNIFDKAKLEQDFTTLFASASLLTYTERGRRLLTTFSIYLLNCTHLDVDILEEKMKTISVESGEHFVSAADRLMEKGREEGIAEGIAEGVTRGREEGRAEEAESVALSMLREGMDESLIIKFTQITAQQLQKLKLKLGDE